MNEMNWSGGTMAGSGRTVIPPGASLNLANPATVALNTRTLENGGTVIWTGAGNLNVNAVITNRAEGLFELRNNATFVWQAGSSRFDNAGTLRKAIGSNTSTFGSGVTLNNYGTAEVQSGTMLVSAFCTNSGTFTLSAGTTLRFANGGSSTGPITAPANALVEWSANIFSLNPGAQLNGPGLYKVTGTLTFNTDVTVQKLDLLGVLNGPGMLTVNSVMNWSDGTMGGSGRTRIAPGATLNLNNADFVMLQRTLENAGTAVWTGANSITMDSAVITNRAGALFDARNAASIMWRSGANRFDNAGTFRKSANTGTTTLTSGVTFNNYNRVEIRNGIVAANGGYTSTTNALLNCALGGTTAGSGFGQLQVAGTVNVNGALSVDLTNGFLPATNDAFAVLTWDTQRHFREFLLPLKRGDDAIEQRAKRCDCSGHRSGPRPGPCC